MKRIIRMLLLTIAVTLLFSVNVFAAAEQEDNNTRFEANSIALNIDCTGSISSSSDEDWYKIVLDKSGNIRLSFSHEGVDSDHNLWEVRIPDSVQHKQEIPIRED